MRVEIHGLEVRGFHGANEAERTDGQAFLFDVVVELPEPTRDELAATVDYRAVRDCVQEISVTQTYVLLESLAVAVAEAIASRFAVDRVEVRVRKPGIAWAEWTAASASRP